MNIEIVLTPTTGPIDEPLHGFVSGLGQSPLAAVATIAGTSLCR